MLSNQLVKEVIRDWSFWNASPAQSIARQVELPKALVADLALIIQGVRRCGKSTLLAQLPLLFGLNFRDCYYCNFEDPRLLNSLNYSLLDQIVQLAREETTAEMPRYFFLDEIQNVDGWEKWLHTQLERPKKNYFVLTGSNSHLLSGELGTAVTGRQLTIELYPFSLSEYRQVFPKNSLEDYLSMGGFPRALTYESPYKLLQEYFNDIILRDVLKRVRSRSPESIKQVIKMAFDSCGSELSYRKIAATTGLTVDTVKSYLEACEQAYLIFACPYFAFSEKKRLLKQKKYYPIDTGMRYAITGTSGRDLGKSLELAVFLHLKKRYEQVYYWQEIHQGEVDFVVLDGKTIIPYQVTWHGPELRHEKSLECFYSVFPQAEEAIFITQENAEDFLMS